MKARLSEMLQGLTIQQNNVTVTFTEIEKVDGEMTAMNRKGKTYVSTINKDYFLFLLLFIN